MERPWTENGEVGDTLLVYEKRRLEIFLILATLKDSFSVPILYPPLNFIYGCNSREPCIFKFGICVLVMIKAREGGGAGWAWILCQSTVNYTSAHTDNFNRTPLVTCIIAAGVDVRAQHATISTRRATVDTTADVARRSAT